MRFNQHDNRLYIDMDWENDLTVDEYLIIECYRKLDPTSYADVYNDQILKRYVTELFRKQWGENLSKFAGVTMIGGVTLNGADIISRAESNLDSIEKEIRVTYETPPHFLLG